MYFRINPKSNETVHTRKFIHAKRDSSAVGNNDVRVWPTRSRDQIGQATTIDVRPPHKTTKKTFFEKKSVTLNHIQRRASNSSGARNAVYKRNGTRKTAKSDTPWLGFGAPKSKSRIFGSWPTLRGYISELPKS